MEMMGFIFGLAGLSFALMAKEQISKLKKEFETLKKSLEGSGVIKENIESNNNKTM